MDFRNGVKMRKDLTKPGPSGMSRNTAFALPEKWGGRDYLLPTDIEVIREIKAAMGGDALLEFVPEDFSIRAQAAHLYQSDLTSINYFPLF